MNETDNKEIVQVHDDRIRRRIHPAAFAVAGVAAVAGVGADAKA